MSPISLTQQSTEQAEEILGIFEHHERSLKDLDCWGNVTALLEGRFADAAAAPVGSGLDAKQLQPLVLDASIYRLWRRTRVIYTLHPDMLAELKDCSTGVLAGEVFTSLPHTNPLVLFPEPLPVTLPTGEPGELCGFFVYGVTGANTEQRRFVSTDDDGACALGLMSLTRVLDEPGGRGIDWDMARSTVELSERFTLEDAVAGTLKRYQIDWSVRAQTSQDGVERWVRDTVGLALTVLMYLCSDVPDAEEVPARRRGKGKAGHGARKAKPPRVIKLGWRLGPALLAARRAAHEQALHAGTGRRQPPHQRRSHVKTVWTGKEGQRRPETRFIKAYMVGLDQLADGARLDTRVIPIK